jgi:SAM-dependent methyltransferase
LDAEFEQLVQLAQDQQLVGWDFSWLASRSVEEPLPWDYRMRVLRHKQGVRAMLDLGTGGGEMLASLAPFPPLTWATESYAPNVPIARSCLEPLGVRVADLSFGQPCLPFEDNTFDLVINRHTGLAWSEVARVLRPGGRFITQQVGGENCMAFNRYFQEHPRYEYGSWTLAEAVRHFEQAGLEIVTAREAFPRWWFKDIAGVIFYLQAIPWQIEGFTVEDCRQKLRQLHQKMTREGGFIVRQHRLLVEAVKPNNG